MEFGKLDDIRGVDWSIPPNDPSNLERFKSEAPLKIHVGSPAWGQKSWIGKIYPPKTQADEFLHYYSRNFNCIELNTAHYRIPSEEITYGWLKQVPPEFKFCPKVHKDISHSSFGMFDKALLGDYLRFMENLRDHVGPAFIQFHENFKYQDKIALFKFLEQWPNEFELTIELRHADWFPEHKILPALGEYLHKRGMGLVITDVAGRRDVLHTSLTSSWTMLRLIGNDLDVSDEMRLQNWSERLAQWQQQGLKDIYLFLHQPDDIMTIEFARMASKIFHAVGYTDFPEFAPIKERDLFNI
jgi:uncharacterized protein YecE (DUF72 family)